MLQPPVLASQAVPTQQNQPQFVQPKVATHGTKKKQPSPFKQGINPSAKSFNPAAEAQPEDVPSTPEKKIPKSNGGQGVKK